MAISTVNISFQEELLRQIDNAAKNESRTRSELVREAARSYIQRKQKWDSIFAYGTTIGKEVPMNENELIDEIKAARNK